MGLFNGLSTTSFIDIKNCPTELIEFKEILEKYEFSELFDTCVKDLKEPRKKIYEKHKKEIGEIIQIHLRNLLKKITGGKAHAFYDAMQSEDSEPKARQTSLKKFIFCLFNPKNENILDQTTVSFWKNQILFDQVAIDLSGIPLNYIPEALLIFDKMAELNLSETKLKGGVEVLAQMPALKKLVLVDNEITELPNFSEFKTLECVDLTKNPITRIDLKPYKLPGGKGYKQCKILIVGLNLTEIKDLPNNLNDVFPGIISGWESLMEEMGRGVFGSLLP